MKMDRLIFYSLFDYFNKKNPSDTPAFNAYLLISIIQCVNILTLFGLINYFIKLDIPKNTAVFMGIILYVTITVINFFRLFMKRHSIISHYKDYATTKINKWKNGYGIYLILSISIFLIVIFNLVTPKY